MRASVFAIAFFVAVLSAMPGLVTAEARQTANGFATPEDAVRAYLVAFAHADLEELLETVAIDEVADGYRFDLAVDRVRSFTPYGLLAPADYEFFAAMNRTERIAATARQARTLAYSLLTDTDLSGITTDLDRAWALDFIDRVDPASLAALTSIDIRAPRPDLLDDSRVQTSLASTAMIDGADERTERVALVAFGSDLYIIGFSLVRFDDGWKVLDQYSALAGTSATGAAEPTTAAAFDELTSAD